MGGKNAIIVDADADLDEAVQGRGRFGVRLRRAEVLGRVAGDRAGAGIYDQFLARLVEATQEPDRGPGGRSRAARVGPVIDAEARDRILEGHRSAARRKRDWRYAGRPRRRWPTKAISSARTIFADVPEIAVMAPGRNLRPGAGGDEGAGPGRRPAHRQRHEVRADGRLYSRSPANIERVKRRFRVGNLYINRKMHRGAGGPPAVRRVQAERHRLEGRRAGLPAAVRAAADDHREHDAPRLRPGRRMRGWGTRADRHPPASRRGQL